MKSEKWQPRALQGTLIGYDGHTIYRVHIQEQNKVIRIKDLCIFEDYETKTETSLLVYQDTLTFQGFYADDDNERDAQETASTPDNNRKVRNLENAEARTSLPDQKVGKAKSTTLDSTNDAPPRKSRKINITDAVRSSSRAATQVPGRKVGTAEDANNRGVDPNTTNPSFSHKGKHSQSR